VLAEWLDAAEATDGTMSMVRALTRRSLNAMGQGEWESAEADLQRAHSIIAQWRFHEYVLAAQAFAASARLAIHRHDLDAAREHFMHAMRLRTHATWALPTYAVDLRLELANSCLALADPAGARNLLREIDDILHRRPDLGLLNEQVEALRERLAGAPAGAVGVSTLTPAELRLLPYLPTHLTFREIGTRLFISRNTVATQSGSIYRKLGASSRGEAVIRARALGLLG
jgi:LuxR family maltose regulon positive regulatory protein